MSQQTDLWQKKRVIEEVLHRHQVETSPLTEKLRLVSQGISHGISLHQLMEQISAKEQPSATAIALSWYCFATTPQDFRLSIQRVIRVEPNLAWLTTALTGTLSGTYNGITAISGNWRAEIENHNHWDLEQHLLVKLFKSWLGIYSGEKNYGNHNLEVDAIAPPRLIQPRQSLKLISQSFPHP